MSCFYNKNCISVYESKKIKTNENKYIGQLSGNYNKGIDKYSYIFYKTTKDNSDAKPIFNKKLLYTSVIIFP